MTIFTPAQAKIIYEKEQLTVQENIANSINRRLVANSITLERDNGSIVVDIRKVVIDDNYKDAIIVPYIPEKLIDAICSLFKNNGWTIEKEQEIPTTLLRVRKAK